MGVSIPIYCAHTRLIDPNTLKPNPVNPNRHSAHQISLLASIILLNENKSAPSQWNLPEQVSVHI
jgi:hypothetical protein